MIAHKLFADISFLSEFLNLNRRLLTLVGVEEGWVKVAELKLDPVKLPELIRLAW
jgi:hypothetical protein